MSKRRRERTVRRETARKFVKLGKDRERVFVRDPGGSAERPIEVATPAVIEARARAISCPLCDGEHEVLEHAAVTTERGSLREARLQCRRCASRRSVWFRLARLN